MSSNSEYAGAASAALQREAHAWWAETATANGTNVLGLTESMTLEERIAWAIGLGFAIGVAYSRYSTDKQDSTSDQIRACVKHAALHMIYVPPEFICVDEAVKGSKRNRLGLNRAKDLLEKRAATVFLVFKLSRLFRSAHQALRFFQETLVAKSLRGISVSESIDTADKKAWRLQTGIRGLMDEELLDAISDHVRQGQIGLFLNGYPLGALPVGYRRLEDPKASRTKHNLPRTKREVHPDHAALIREHYELIAGGMSIMAGWRKWVAANGPSDPRSPAKSMSPTAYRKMLSRNSYTGHFSYGRRRNFWNSGADTVGTMLAPANEVEHYVSEELRIVSDELFDRVQQALSKNARSPRTRKNKVHNLADLVVGTHFCAACNCRFYMSGSKSPTMRCKNNLCPMRAIVNREKVVAEVCKALTVQLMNNDALVDAIMSSITALMATETPVVDERIQTYQRRIRTLQSKIRELEELAGEGGDTDRQRRKEMICSAQNERLNLEAQVVGLTKHRGGGREKPLTREDVVAHLAEIHGVLDAAAKGTLGPEVVNLAADVYNRLVGGKVVIVATRRPARKRFLVKARFTPELFITCHQRLSGIVPAAGDSDEPTVELWITRGPRVDNLSDEVQHLYDVEKLGFDTLNKLLEAKYKQKIGCGNCCAAYRRYYQMRGLPLPPRRGTTGRARKNP